MECRTPRDVLSCTELREHAVGPGALGQGGPSHNVVVSIKGDYIVLVGLYTTNTLHFIF